MMSALLQPAAKYVKCKKGLQIYDLAFMIHTKYTVAILMACTCLVSAKQYFGDPIECLAGKSENRAFINSMCWTIGAFVMSEPTDADAVAERVSHLPGQRIYLRFYQWIAIYLLMQSLVFYLPAYLWKIWEGRRLSMLCDGSGDAILKDDKFVALSTSLVQYFTADYKEVHFGYATKYAFCEFLNFACSVANMMFLNVFLNGFWPKYIKALAAIPAYEWNTWNRITSEIFPKVAKCAYKRYGSGGGIEEIDALCMLPLNIVNEKVFAFLWPWFVFIALMAAFKLIYRIVLMCNGHVRLRLLRLNSRSMSLGDMRCIVDNLSYGDWFLLYKVSKNVNPLIYRKLMEDLYEHYRALNDQV